MARLRTKHEFAFSKDSTETNQSFERVQREDEVTDAFTAASSIAPVTVGPLVAKAVGLQGMTNVQFVYIETDKTVLVSINGGAGIRVAPRTNAITAAVPLPGRFYLWTDLVTSVAVTNPSTTDTAQVTVVFAGS